MQNDAIKPETDLVNFLFECYVILLTLLSFIVIYLFVLKPLTWRHKQGFMTFSQLSLFARTSETKCLATMKINTSSRITTLLFWLNNCKIITRELYKLKFWQWRSSSSTNIGSVYFRKLSQYYWRNNEESKGRIKCNLLTQYQTC